VVVDLSVVHGQSGMVRVGSLVAPQAVQCEPASWGSNLCPLLGCLSLGAVESQHFILQLGTCAFHFIFKRKKAVKSRQ
jgi:hypothetical protein